MDEQRKEARKQTIVIAAAIFAARDLANDWNGGRSPRAPSPQQASSFTGARACRARRFFSYLSFRVRRTRTRNLLFLGSFGVRRLDAAFLFPFCAAGAPRFRVWTGCGLYLQPAIKKGWVSEWEIFNTVGAAHAASSLPAGRRVYSRPLPAGSANQKFESPIFAR